MTSLLRLSGISFDYAGRQVFCNLSLDLEAGSCTALAGPNGAGKTTLLRIAAGTLKPSGGCVLINDRSLATIPRRERSRLVALVPQQLDVPFDFTVQQIVEQGRTPYTGSLRGLTREDRLAVDRALELTDVSRLRHRIFNELSGGERQRVKIALGLAQQPRLLLLDEPTQNLDIGRQAELIDLLDDLRRQRITIFAAIHDLHLVQGNFSTAHLLGINGSLRSGPPEEVLSAENLMSTFGCSPGRHPMLTQLPEMKETT